MYYLLQNKNKICKCHDIYNQYVSLDHHIMLSLGIAF